MYVIVIVISNVVMDSSQKRLWNCWVWVCVCLGCSICLVLFYLSLENPRMKMMRNRKHFVPQRKTKWLTFWVYYYLCHIEPSIVVHNIFMLDIVFNIYAGMWCVMEWRKIGKRRKFNKVIIAYSRRIRMECIVALSNWIFVIAVYMKICDTLLCWCISWYISSIVFT